MKVVALVLAFLAVAYALEEVPFGEEVEYINSIKTTWKAGYNVRFQGLTKEQIQWQMGVLEGGEPAPLSDLVAAEVIPDSFDARTQWSTCPTVGEIRDQGSCGSCWVCGYKCALPLYCFHPSLLGFWCSGGHE